MGAHSTLTISKNKARATIYERLHAISDEKLEYMMDVLLSDHLYNCNFGDPDDSRTKEDEFILDTIKNNL